MEWTTEIPNQEGWYWAVYEYGEDAYEDRVQLKMEDGKLTALVGGKRVCDLSFFMRWYGPV